MIILLFLILLVLIGIWYSSSKEYSVVRMVISSIMHPIAFMQGFFEGRASVRQNKLMVELHKNKVEDREKLLGLFKEEDRELIKDMSLVGHIEPKDYLKVKEQIDIYYKFKDGQLDIRLLNNIDSSFISYIKEEKISELRTRSN